MAINRNKTYNIGEMRQKVQLQNYTTVSDGMGGNVATWTTSIEPYCDIHPLSGGEAYHYGAIHGNVTHRIRLRYTALATTESRIVYNSRVFNIKASLNKGEDSYFLELLASEEAS